MTDRELDLRIRDGLLTAAGLRWADVEADPAPQPSPAYLAWERRFLADPFAAARTGALPAPKRRRGLRWAVCAALLAALTFGGAVAASPQLRAAVVRFWETYVVYRFLGEEGEQPDHWALTALPECYRQTGWSMLPSGYATAVYEDGAGGRIDLTYSPMDRSYLVALDTQGRTRVDTVVRGCPAQAYRAEEGAGRSFLLLTDEEAGLVFLITAPGGYEALAALADGLAEAE